jgi:hypothetical protein
MEALVFVLICGLIFGVAWILGKPNDEPSDYDDD